jgi:hypothetical protein
VRYGIEEQAFAGQRLVRQKSISPGLIFWLLLDQAKSNSLSGPEGSGSAKEKGNEATNQSDKSQIDKTSKDINPDHSISLA